MLQTEWTSNHHCSILIVYAYKCFVLLSESKLIASIAENTQTSDILHSMAYTVGTGEAASEDIIQIIRRMKNALCRAHIRRSGSDIVFWDENEKKEKFEWKISADKLNKLVSELYLRNL